jgi:hypothetical protein
MGIEHETAKRSKATSKKALLNKQPIKTDEVVPAGAVDSTPADDGDED